MAKGELMMGLLKPDGPNCYRIRRSGKMKVDAVLYLNRELYRSFADDSALQQLIDAASLPGIVGPVIGMPDIHSGFGLPIGGVMASDASEGLVSAGAVGMDINCGVRLLRTGIDAASLDKPLLRRLISDIAQRVPGGVGRKSKHASAVRNHFRDFVERGAPYLVELGYGRSADLDFIEERGFLPGADINAAGDEAVNRGIQLSTIGGGNHFIELGYVDRIFDREDAVKLGLLEGCLTVLIHTGSRGFGHQICTDYTAIMRRAAARMKISLPSEGLAAVPIGSPEGKRYLAAMACAVNFAFCNRQWITDDVRKAFAAVLGGADEDYGLELVYDLAHNIAKFEDVAGRRLLIHRKGATRALPPGHPGNPGVYRESGHPVLIPGSMGTASHVIKAEALVEKTFYSVNHGAGRLLSRRAARREISVVELQQAMNGILLPGRNYRSYLDEAPQAYKDIDAVIDTFASIGFTRKTARLRPLAVIKGEGSEG